MPAAEISPAPVSLEEPKPASHVASLDGLRAFAVLGVMYYHSRLPYYDFLWVGVDLFFVLSGFLITTLLLKEKQKNGNISLLKFWGRRFLRLMPAYWLFVGTCTILILSGVGWIDSSDGWSARRYITSLWLYFSNYAPMETWQYQDISGPLWSLAVEEQFYFVWPFLCAVTLRFTRRPWIVGWLLVLGTLICRHFADNDFQLHLLLYTRGVCILAGCAVALSLANGLPAWVVAAVNATFVRVGLIAACIVFVVAGTHYQRKWGYDEMESIHRIFVPIAAGLFPCVVVMLWYGRRDALSRTLAWPALVYIGRISYGIYLYHALFKWLVWDWGASHNVTEHLGWALKVIVRNTAYFGGTIAVASISYLFVERPFLKLKERLR